MHKVRTYTSKYVPFTIYVVQSDNYILFYTEASRHGECTEWIKIENGGTDKKLQRNKKY